MRKNKLPESYYQEENIIREKIASDGEPLVNNAITEERGGQIRANMDQFLDKDETEKWALYISACGGFGFILKEEAKNLNMEPSGETRTIHNVPDAEGKVTDSMEAHTYEVYG